MVRGRVRVLLPLLAAGSLWIGLHAQAATITISDAAFADANWSLTQSTFGGGGTVTAGQITQSANLLRSIQHAFPAGPFTQLLGVHIFNAATFDPAVSGPILSIGYSENAICLSGCFGDGQATGLALVQNGMFYLTDSFLLTGASTAFHPLSDPGLSAADLALVSLSATTFFDDTQHPDFSASGAPIQFGFLRANTFTGGGAVNLTAGIDNWQVVITTPDGTAIPAPPTLLLLGVAFLALSLSRRRSS